MLFRSCGTVFSRKETQRPSVEADPSQAIQPASETELAPAHGGISLQAAPDKYSTWDEFRTLSPAIQSALIALATRPLPDMRGAPLYRLPENLPPKVDELARPLATLTTPGESRSLAWTLGTFVAVVVCGLLVVVGINLGMPGARQGAGGVISGPSVLTVIVVVGIAFIAWYAYCQQPMLYITVWIFENGLLLQRGNDIEACAWEDIKDFRMDRDTGRLTSWITTHENCHLMFNCDQTPAIMPVVEYVKIKITSAHLLPKLRRIFAGERVKLGSIAIDRTGLATPRIFAPWAEVQRVVNDNTSILIEIRNQPAWHSVRYADVAFPLLLLSVAHIMLAEKDRLAAVDA